LKIATITGPETLSAKSAERILRQLPQWFGIESALLAYARECESLPNLLAVADTELVGFATLREHNAATLELSCVALVPQWHRSGVGSRLCLAAESWWARRGGKLLQVKTLGPSRPDPNYLQTRAFYGALGFLPVEEFSGLWPGNPCLLLVKPIDADTRRDGVRASVLAQ
jgi:GNAT superfamily N-acetyltransferase